MLYKALQIGSQKSVHKNGAHYKNISFLNILIFTNISLYFLLMFINKGETIKNFLIFSSLLFWIVTIIKENERIQVLKDPRIISFLLFFLSIVISSIFSFDPDYSISKLKGEPLKALIVLLILSTIPYNRIKIKILILIGVTLLTLLVLSSYYSFFIKNNPVFSPDTFLFDLSYNKFVFFMNILFSFLICNLFIYKRKSIIYYLALFLLLISFISVILSGSRGGYLGFGVLVCLWIIFLIIKFEKFRKYAVKLILILIFISLLTLYLGINNIPYLKSHIESTKEHIYTFNHRIELWEIAIEIWAKRPLIGWGFGDFIFNDENLYRSIGKKPPEWIGTHNIFIRFLFHTGLIGFLSFIVFIFFNLKSFIKKAISSSSDISFVLFAITASIFAGFIAHSFFEDFAKLYWLTFYIGLGIGIDRIINENCNN